MASRRRRYQCPGCPSTYELKHDLDSHRRRDREFCAECNQWVCRLGVHTRSVHTNPGVVDDVDQQLVQPKTPFRDDVGFYTAYMAKLGEISDYKHIWKFSQTWNKSIDDTFTYRNLTLWLWEIYQSNRRAFKINMGIGFLLYNPVEKIYRYHYVSENSLLFDRSVVIDSVKSLKAFIERVKGLDLATSAYLTKPSSNWVLAGITNIQCRVIVLPGVMLGIATTELPDYLKNSKNIYCLTGLKGVEYKDNLCLFRCIAITSWSTGQRVGKICSNDW